MRHLTFLFSAMGLGYVILVINLRALNRGKYLATAVTEMAYALINFVLIRQVAQATTWAEAVAYAAGATSGSLLAMWFTQHWD